MSAGPNAYFDPKTATWVDPDAEPESRQESQEGSDVPGNRSRLGSARVLDDVVVVLAPAARAGQLTTGELAEAMRRHELIRRARAAA